MEHSCSQARQPVLRCSIRNHVPRIHHPTHSRAVEHRSKSGDHLRMAGERQALTTPQLMFRALPYDRSERLRSDRRSRAELPLRSPRGEGGFLGRASHTPELAHKNRQTNYHRTPRLRSAGKSGRAYSSVLSLVLLRRNVRNCGSPPTLRPKVPLTKVGALAAPAQTSALVS
jgi:hypothetical protein